IKNVEKLSNYFAKTTEEHSQSEILNAIEKAYNPINGLAEGFEKIYNQGTTIPSNMEHLHLETMEVFYLVGESGNKIMEGIKMDSQESIDQSDLLFDEANKKLYEVIEIMESLGIEVVPTDY